MKIAKILVVDRLFKEMEISLRGKVQKEFRFLPEDEVTVEDWLWAEAYVGFKPPANFNLNNIKWVHCLGAGVDRIIYHKAWKREVLLTRTIASFGQKISEYCLSYILRDLQLHGKFEDSKRAKEWCLYMPLTVSNLKVVVFGTGLIGRELANNLQHFGADVSGVSLSGEAKTPFSRVVTPDQVGQVLSGAHWVINTLPYTSQTANLFDGRLFQYLDKACFINVGRGASVDEESLLDALELGKLRLAVLDVFREEPLPNRSLLWSHPAIVVTPHISALTSLEDAVVCFLRTLENVEEGIRPDNVVDTDKGY